MIFVNKLLKKARIDIRVKKKRILMYAKIALKKRKWIQKISFLLRIMSVRMFYMNTKCAITARLNQCGGSNSNAKSARIMICVKVTYKK